jgi:hypothetical protein
MHTCNKFSHSQIKHISGKRAKTCVHETSHYQFDNMVVLMKRKVPDMETDPNLSQMKTDPDPGSQKYGIQADPDLHIGSSASGQPFPENVSTRVPSRPRHQRFNFFHKSTGHRSVSGLSPLTVPSSPSGHPPPVGPVLLCLVGLQTGRFWPRHRCNLSSPPGAGFVSLAAG